MFLTGLIIRVLYITFAHSYRIRSVQEHFNFGYEMGRVARALASGYGYANPFNGHTGPTAWVPPLYPLLMAGVFKLFGIYTALSAWMMLSLNSVFSAAIAVFIYYIALRCYGRKVALWSGWIWALYPAAMQYAVRSIWEMSLSTMLLTAAIALAVKMRGITPREQRPESGPVRRDPGTGNNRQTTKQWLLFGLLWALIGLSNSTLLIFLPACGLWVLFGSPSRAIFLRAVASALVFIAVVSPWMIRNYRVFHTFVPFRANFGAELHMGNNPTSNGLPWGKTVNGVYQVRQYTEMGEVRYAKEQAALAKAWIHSHPKRFAELSLLRFYCFWSTDPHSQTKHWFLVLVRNINYCVPTLLAILGLAFSLKRRTPAAWLFLWAFLLLPFTYYFVVVEARFRHPLEPLIVMLSVFVIQSATPRRELRKSIG